MTHILRVVPAIVFALALLAPGGLLLAAEINYGALRAQIGDELVLRYNGPSSGEQFYRCDVGGDCERAGATEPSVVPKPWRSYGHTLSNDSSLLLLHIPHKGKVYYALYQFLPKKKVIGWVPYTKEAKVYFAKDNSAVMFKNGTTWTRYTIDSKTTDTMTLPHELSFMSISPKGTYVTGYNYGTLRHEVWRFADGKMLESPSSMQSYLEFAEDESRLAFLEDVAGFKTLFVMDADELGSSKPTSLMQLTEPNTETEDYLFVDDTLYFMANVDGPLEWDLFRNDDGDEVVRVDTDVSYGDYLKRVRVGGESYLAYLKVEGKNSYLRLTKPGSDTVTVLRPVRASAASDEIMREVVEVADRTGVLWSPEDEARHPALFIWMHGGPQRQVAKGYHPYLSYAVYDELLERLVEGGHYVYKIDYTGSTGYGAAFRKALHMKIGDVEMRDIENTVDELEDELGVRNVYLVGNSYGGYMALRGIVDMPEKLDGVVSINGVSNWYTLIDRIPSSPFKTLFEGVPDTHNLDAYKQASVFVGLDEIEDDKKVLVVWGEKDATVPVWQSTEYVEYAEEVGVNVETLAFPDEEHIIRERESLDALCGTVTDFLEVDGVRCER